MKNVSVNHQPSFSAKSSITDENEFVYSTNHALDVNIAGDIVVGDINLTEVGGSPIALGQTTMSASLPVTIASNQSALPVSQSGTWNIGTLGTITNPLPSGTNVIGHVITDTGSTTVVTGTVTISGSVNATQSGNWSTRTLDGAGNTIGSTSNALDVNIKSATSITVSGTVAATQSGTWNVGLNAGSNAIGSITNTSFAATQATASSLNATVVGTGTFATQVTSNPLVSGGLVGQAKIAVTSTAVRLNGGTSQPLTNGIIISAPSGNVAPILIGGSGVTNTADGTGNGYVLAPGASISFAVNNTNVLYINGSSGDYVSWAGS